MSLKGHSPRQMDACIISQYVHILHFSYINVHIMNCRPQLVGLHIKFIVFHVAERWRGSWRFKVWKDGRLHQLHSASMFRFGNLHSRHRSTRQVTEIRRNGHQGERRMVEWYKAIVNHHRQRNSIGRRSSILQRRDIRSSGLHPLRLSSRFRVPRSHRPEWTKLHIFGPVLQRKGQNNRFTRKQRHLNFVLCFFNINVGYFLSIFSEVAYYVQM